MSDLSVLKLPNNQSYNLKDSQAVGSAEFSGHTLTLQKRNQTTSEVDLENFDALNVTDLTSGNLINTGSARFINGLYGNVTGNADTATKLETARTIRTNLASTSTASFDGSANITPGVTGTLGVGNGGTGQTSAVNAANAFANALSTGSSTPTDADYYIAQYAGGGTTTTSYHRRPHSALWSYIQSKINSVLGLNASTYSGKAATAGTADSATSATNLGTSTNVGNESVPVYFKNGLPTVIQNNITGSGTSGYLVKFNGANSITNGPQLGSATNTFLRNDGTWASPVGTQYDVVSKNAAGLVPQLPNESTTTKFLRQDGTWAKPSDSDTHLTGHFYVGGSSATGNAATTNGNTYLILADNSNYDRRKISGTAPVSVTSNASGEIAIAVSSMGAATSSTDGTSGLVPAPGSGKQSSFLRGDGTWATPTNTTYSAGVGLTLSSNKFNLDMSGTAAGSGMRYINTNDMTTWTAQALSETDSIAFTKGNVTDAYTTGHMVWLNVRTIGTPFQLVIHDSAHLCFYKRWWKSADSTWSAWYKMDAGYADTAGSATTADTATSANTLNASHGNELFLGTNNQTYSTLWFNYRSTIGGATSGNTAITGYYFGNRNAKTTGVTLYADNFSGNAASATKANITSNKYGIAYYTDAAGAFGSTATGTSGQLLQSGGSSATPSWITATNSNTASTIVKRDSSGGFQSGTISATMFQGIGGGNKVIYVDDNIVSTSDNKVTTTTKLTTSDSDGEWLKALLVKLCDTYPNVAHTVFEGFISPNSRGYYKVYIYDTSYRDSTTQLPRYSYGEFRKFTSNHWNFGTIDFNFFWYQIVYNSGTWAISTTGTAAALSFPSSNLNAIADVDDHGKNAQFAVAKVNKLTGYATGGPENNDGFIMSMGWSASWGHQLFFDDSGYSIKHRYNSSGTWQRWYDILDGYNYTSYTVTKTGSGASGTWGISITGSSTALSGLNSSWEPQSGTSNRPTTANINFADNKARYFLATSSMTEGKPSADAHILHLPWDNGAWDVQLAVLNSKHIQIRGEAGTANTWENWITVLDSNNYGNYALPLTGGTLTGLLLTAGTDIILGTSGTSSNDSGDLVWRYGNGNEKMRIWGYDEYTVKQGPNFRIYNSSGTSLYSGTLPLADGSGASGTWGISITGNAKTASMPEGFSTGSTSSASWGNQTGTGITTWNETNSGSIEFRRDNPSSGKLSIKVDGRFYGNEGNSPAMLMQQASGYWGLASPDAADDVWIRTTSYGIIPYQSGGSGSGHQSIGTSSWYFQSAYIDNIYGELHGNATTATTANAVAWANVTNKPITLAANTGGLSSGGWATLGGRSSGAKVTVSYTSSAATWNSAKYSAAILFGAQDTKGMLDIAHNTPIVTFAGSWNAGATDDNPTWWLKLKGTSGQTYDLSTMLTTSNYSSYALPLSGGTVTGDVSFKANVIIQGTTSGSTVYDATNPKITFKNSNSTQNIQLIMTDYDSVVSPASLTLVGNQSTTNGGEYFIAPNIRATSRIEWGTNAYTTYNTTTESIDFIFR